MSSKKTTVSIDEAMLQELDIIADVLGVTRNKVITIALEDYIKRTSEKAKAIASRKEELKKMLEEM